MGTDKHPTTVGTLLKELRAGAELSLYELSRRTGYNRSTLMRFEDGTRVPSLETLNVLAHALHVEPEKLYDAAWQDSEKPLPSPRVYLRSKYHLSDQQIADLEATIERIAAEANDDS